MFLLFFRFDFLQFGIYSAFHMRLTDKFYTLLTFDFIWKQWSFSWIALLIFLTGSFNYQKIVCSIIFLRWVKNNLFGKFLVLDNSIPDSAQIEHFWLILLVFLNILVSIDWLSWELTSLFNILIIAIMLIIRTLDQVNNRRRIAFRKLFIIELLFFRLYLRLEWHETWRLYSFFIIM